MPTFNGGIPPLDFFKMIYGGRSSAVAHLTLSDKCEYKARCETIIFDKDNNIFAMLTKEPWKYEFPGGTCELSQADYLNNPPIMDILNSTAMREIYEESNMTVAQLKFTNMYRTYKYKGSSIEWARENLARQGLYTVGDLSFIFTARFDHKYNLDIEECDKYKDMVKKGRFYPYAKLKPLLVNEHKKIIEAYIENNTKKKISKESCDDYSIY